MRTLVLGALWLTRAATAIVFAADPSPTGGLTGRPAEWARPVTGTTLDNYYRVSDDLYRSEQPHAGDLPALQALGIKSLLDLRPRHADSRHFARAGVILIDEGMRAGDVTVEELVSALRKFRAAPKPVLVHCWHGSDRTGFFVAGYRIICQGWTRQAAIAELEHGGFGFHTSWYPNIVRCLAEMDVENVRRRVLATDAEARP